MWVDEDEKEVRGAMIMRYAATEHIGRGTLNSEPRLNINEVHLPHDYVNVACC